MYSHACVLKLSVHAVQDAQGESLCQYKEFEASDAGDSDETESDWHAQKKGCCVIM